MTDSVKKQAIARLFQVLEPLKIQNNFRAIERKQDLFASAAVLPAIQVVIGDEDVIEGSGEDNRGYTMEFPVAIKIMFEEQRDPYTLQDDVSAWIQEKAESDLQLARLINWLRYIGDTPFTNEIGKPGGGIILHYLVQYRRERARPDVNY